MNSYYMDLNCALSDPLEVLKNWNSHDQTPCNWNGVTRGIHTAGTIGILADELIIPNSFDQSLQFLV